MDANIKLHTLPDVHHTNSRPGETRFWLATAFLSVSVLVLKIYAGITMRLSSRGILELDISAAVSYQPSTGTVNAFLQGFTTDQQTEVRKQLQYLSVLARHPLLLPVVLVEMKMNVIKDVEKWLWNGLLMVEMQSGKTGAPAINTQEYHQSNKSCDWESLAVKALGVLQIAPLAVDHANTLLLTVKEIEKMIDDLNSLAEPAEADYLTLSGRMLSEKLRFLSHGTQVIVSKVQYIIKRAEAQQSAVFSLIMEGVSNWALANETFKVYYNAAQREARLQLFMAQQSGQVARASKRDSSAMKGIAVLTMVFLPGTFIAVGLSLCI